MQPSSLFSLPASPALSDSCASVADSVSSDATLFFSASEQSLNPHPQRPVLVSARDTWEIGDLLGSGTFSQVRRARNVRTGLEAVCKSTPVPPTHPHFKLYALREAAVLLAIPPHPCIPQVYDVIVTSSSSSPFPLFPSSPVSSASTKPSRHHVHTTSPTSASTSSPTLTYHIIMQRAKGVELFAYAQTCPGGRVPEDEVRVIIGQVADALAHLHTHHILHRDIKLDNVIVDPDLLQCTLIDFNLATMCSEGGMMVEPVGCINYASPQLLLSALLGTPYPFSHGRSDLHSLGVVAYGALVGFFPYRATSPRSLLDEIHTRARARLHWPAEPGSPVDKPRHLISRPARKMVQALCDPLLECSAREVGKGVDVFGFLEGWKEALAFGGGGEAVRSDGVVELDPPVTAPMMDGSDLVGQMRAMEAFVGLKCGWGSTGGLYDGEDGDEVDGEGELGETIGSPSPCSSSREWRGSGDCDSPARSVDGEGHSEGVRVA
ncbi:kinase-like protein [Gonapodya prolifera JEL478]|uniref:Kinase-like protein n=1 Tax=Gonapodya prolifera (strain JEL478) TaxID=1344416 RepID=A0A139AH05_GONPJ|nr:kinase-like protein [Gonapodya prolifera JEL478]|eukprot:KXS15844.1 kinase-like protein [Gonapodya prolifera JEL478]